MLSFWISTTTTTTAHTPSLTAYEFVEVLLGNAAFTRGADCQGDDPIPFYLNATYDSNLWAVLFFLGLGTLANVVLVTYHFTHPAHPKFYLVGARKCQVLTHIGSGSCEIIVGVIMWFAANPAFWARVMCCASFVHSSSALAMVTVVFGTKMMTEPLYLYCIMWKYILIVNCFMNPDCYKRDLSLIVVHHTYAWFRISYKLLESLRLDGPYHYSLSTILSGAIILPFVSSSAFMLSVFFTAAYVLLMDKLHPQDAAIKRVEHGRHFDFIDGGCPLASRLKGNPTKEDMAKEVFALLDSDNDGSLSTQEMVQALLGVGMLEKDVVKVMEKYDKDRSETIDYVEFRDQMEYFYVYMYHDMLSYAQKMIDKADLHELIKKRGRAAAALVHSDTMKQSLSEATSMKQPRTLHSARNRIGRFRPEQAMRA